MLRVRSNAYTSLSKRPDSQSCEPVASKFPMSGLPPPGTSPRPYGVGAHVDHGDTASTAAARRADYLRLGKCRRARERACGSSPRRTRLFPPSGCCTARTPSRRAWRGSRSSETSSFHRFLVARKAAEIEASFGVRLADPVDEFNAARHVGNDSPSTRTKVRSGRPGLRLVPDLVSRRGCEPMKPPRWSWPICTSTGARSARSMSASARAPAGRALDLVGCRCCAELCLADNRREPPTSCRRRLPRNPRKAYPGLTCRSS